MLHRRHRGPIQLERAPPVAGNHRRRRSGYTGTAMGAIRRVSTAQPGVPKEPSRPPGPRRSCRVGGRPTRRRQRPPRWRQQLRMSMSRGASRRCGLGSCSGSKGWVGGSWSGSGRVLPSEAASRGGWRACARPGDRGSGLVSGVGPRLEWSRRGSAMWRRRGTWSRPCRSMPSWPRMVRSSACAFACAPTRPWPDADSDDQ